MMSTAARIVVILVLTLGFPLHNFVLRVVNATPVECVMTAVEASDETSGGAMPDKPSPSCKIIGSGPLPASLGLAWAAEPVTFVSVRGDRSSWRPGGPEKPPKRA